MRVLKLEAKAKYLLNKSDKNSKRRAINLRSVVYEKGSDGEVYFSVDSKTYPGKKHIVILASPDFTEDITLNELKKVIKNVDIKVACSCEAFLYWGYKYITYKNKAGIDSETRAPVVRNPSQRGMLCKHIIAVLNMLGVY